MRFPEEADFICVYGWDEVLYKKALGDSRKFIFISEEERMSADSRIQIIHLESPLQIEFLAKKIAWSAVFKKLAVMGNESFKERVEECHLAAHLILSEAADWEVGAMRNARANRGFYRRGMDLKGAFKGVPALIVGAGPSLEKNGHLIKEFEQRALIFAGGSALNVIGIEPHFAASIDKEAPYEQFKRHPYSETPFCYQSRMSTANYALVHGEKLLFPDSSSQALNWLYEEESLDGGWTVGNFLTAVADILGCSPIIFVGMDFCYAEGRKYAQIDAQNSEGLIRIGDCVTQRDWLMAAKWMEGRGINATEGGLMPSVSLAEVLKSCTKEWDLRTRVHNAIQQLPIRQASRWEEWDLSLQRSRQEICEDEIVYQKLLLPMWQIWKPLFEREAAGQNMELHQRLFFQQILEEHGSLL